MTIDKKPVPHGETRAAQGETTVSEATPRLPHERDESVDSQALDPAGSREKSPFAAGGPPPKSPA